MTIFITSAVFLNSATNKSTSQNIDLKKFPKYGYCKVKLDMRYQHQFWDKPRNKNVLGLYAGLLRTN